MDISSEPKKTVFSGVQPSGSGRMDFLWEKKCMKNAPFIRIGLEIMKNIA